jgi:tRNA(fMet)-specific endonuclease VapC
MIDCTLDSTTLIHLTRGWLPKSPVSASVKNAGISHVALGELFLGAFKGSTQRELDKLSVALRGLRILHGDHQTAFLYARVKSDLERAGNVIPENDIWIAAASLQARVPLVTRDAHFKRISDLKVITY